MRDSSWTKSIRVCSFVFNTPHIIFDGRSTQDRLRYPKVLDIAFAEAKIPSLELDPSTATYIIKAENRTLNKSKGSFKLVTSLSYLLSSLSDALGVCSLSLMGQQIPF